MARMLWLGVLPAAIAIAGAGFVACSASSSGSGVNGSGGQADGGGGTSGGGTGGTGGSGATGSGGTGAFGFDSGNGGSGGSAGLTDASACTGQTTTAKQLPLDLFVMMDISGSMTDKTASGQTKWDAVKSAMTNFLNLPASQGLGVGIQYFPLKDPNVPPQCTSSTQCGSGGICVLKTCNAAPNNAVVPCNTNADCTGQGSCVNLGTDCANPANLCAPGQNNCAINGCQKLTVSFCTNETSCLVGDYSKPAVEITTLGSPQPIIASINAQTPSGQTPTGPALKGALDHAAAWAKAHPDHSVAVVFATDGLPTECSPLDINQVGAIASTAATGTPAIDTFVIGVFGPGDTASQQNLDVIAKGGNTGSAFIVDTSGDVGQQFTDALNKIRGQALTCEFTIPAPPDGGTLDYSLVNVSYTANGQKQSLYYVADKSKCDPQTGGWYYDVDPATGGTPTKILVCDSTCNDFKASTTGSQQVDVLLGCKSVTPPPK